MNNNIVNKYILFVDYQDTDAGKVVHHSNYLKFAEKARAHMFRSLFGSNFCKECMLVVKDLQIQYLFPAFLEDTINIETNVINVKNYSILMSQKFYVNSKLITLITLTLVSLSSNFKFFKINSNVKEQLNKYNIGEKIS